MKIRLTLLLLPALCFTSCQLTPPPPPITASVSDEFILAPGRSMGEVKDSEYQVSFVITAR